jgi:hypothetical protein
MLMVLLLVLQVGEMVFSFHAISRSSQMNGSFIAQHFL